MSGTQDALSSKSPPEQQRGNTTDLEMAMDDVDSPPAKVVTHKLNTAEESREAELAHEVCGEENLNPIRAQTIYPMTFSGAATTPYSAQYRNAFIRIQMAGEFGTKQLRSTQGLANCEPG